MNQSGKPSPNPQWNHQPDLPIQISPVFRQPLDFVGVFKWVMGSWFPISERLVILLLAVASWVWFHPAIEQCQNFGWGWIALIYVRNLGLMVLVAGGLHWYFYILKVQDQKLRYDTRPFAKNRRAFTFDNQVKDNMFWTCASGVTIWTAYEVLMMWSMAQGFIPMIDGEYAMVWIIGLIFLIPIWETFYFYLIHRLLHWPPLYRVAHSLHHRNTNIGPWSGLSMHPLEHILYLGSVLIHFVVPASPLIIIYHLQFYTLSAATTHCGYQGVSVSGENRLSLGTYHHQLHHRYFECNYGGLEIPWDKWFGSFHDGTEESHAAFEKRRMDKLA